MNDRVSYTIDVENVGTAATTRVGDRDRHASRRPHLRRVAASSQDWSCGAAGQAVTCEHDGSIAAGASAQTLELLADVDASAAAQVTNTASVSNADDPVAAQRLRRRHRRRRPHRPRDRQEPHRRPAARRHGQLHARRRERGHRPDRGPDHGHRRPARRPQLQRRDGHRLELLGLVGHRRRATTPARSQAAPPRRRSPWTSTSRTTAAAPITNTATVSSGDDADATNDSDTDPADVVTGLDAAVSIRPQVPSGRILPRRHQRHLHRHRPQHRSRGRSPAPVTATVDLPAGLSFVSGTGSGWTCGAAGPDVTCTRASGLAAAAGRSDIAHRGRGRHRCRRRAWSPRPPSPPRVTPSSSNNSAEAPHGRGR